MPITAMWKFFVILLITLKSSECRVYAVDGYDFGHSAYPPPAGPYSVLKPAKYHPDSIIMTLHKPDSYNPTKQITDCYFIGNGTQSMGIVCGDDSVEKYPKSENCFALLLEGNSTKIKSLNLKSLKFQKNCELRAANPVTFRSEQKLYILENSISTSVMNSTQMFLNAPNLTEIDYSSNKITSISAYDFKSATHLTKMSLANNSIHSLDVDAFDDLKELKYLDLSDNLIEKLDEDLFRNNKHLEWIRLRNNPIIRLDSGIFALVKNIATVNIFLQNVTEIDISYETMLRNKLKFQISDEKGLVVNLIDGASNFRYTNGNLTNLVSFNISGHQLNNTKELLKLLGPSITHLDLSANFIGAIDPQTFKSFKKLKVLNLARTNLSNFGFSTMYNQNKLVDLDLSYNQLKRVNFTMLALSLQNLNRLNLEGNDLVEVDTVNSRKFPFLQYLALSKNNFSCDYLSTYLDQWYLFSPIKSNPSDGTHIRGIDCTHYDNQTIEATPSTPTNYFMIEIRIFEGLIVLFCIYFVIKKKPIQQLKRRVWLGSNITYRRDDTDTHDFNVSLDQNSLNGISTK